MEKQSFMVGNQVFLDWINTIPHTSCLLINHVADLRDGVALCDALAHLQGKKKFAEVYRRSAQKGTAEGKAIHNFGLLLKHLDYRNITAGELAADDEQICILLRHIQNIGENSYKSPRFVTPRTSDPSIMPLQIREPSNLPRQIQEHLHKSPPNDNKAKSHECFSSLHNQYSPLAMAKMRSISSSKQLLLQTPKQKETFLDPEPYAPPTHRSAIEQLSDVAKNRIIQWLEAVGLIQPNRVSVEHITMFFQNGVALIDLINILEPRDNTIKQVNRHPSDQAAASANIKKALDYLRRQPKMRPKYLWSDKDILDGNADVIFALLEDMRLFWSKVKRAETPEIRPQLCTSPYRAVRKAQTTMHSRQQSRNLKSHTSNYSHDGSIMSAVSPNNRRSYSQQNLRKSQQQQSLSRMTNVSEISYAALRDWLVALGLGHYLDMETHGLCGDPMRNGVLFVELVQILENIRISNVHNYPKRPSEAQTNLKKVYAQVSQRIPEITSNPTRQIDRILKGNREVIWGFLQILYDNYPHLQAAEILTPGFEIPYNVQEIKRLENSLLVWMFNLGVTGLTECPRTIYHLLPQFQTGVLLADIVNAIFPVRISGIYRDPQNSRGCIRNITKVLGILRKSGKMSQKFVKRTKEIAAGDLASVIGLLEDLHRYADGLLARKRGQDYHSDGPYIGHKTMKRSQSQPPTRKRKSLQPTPADHTPRKPLAQLRQMSNVLNSTGENSFVRERRILTQDISLHNWLARIGFKRKIDLGSAVLEEFRSGVLICQILSQVEGYKLAGVIEQPVNTNEALMNISTAMRHVQQRDSSGRNYKAYEQAILVGDGDAIREVLSTLSVIYRYRSDVLARSQLRKFRV